MRRVHPAYLEMYIEGEEVDEEGYTQQAHKPSKELSNHRLRIRQRIQQGRPSLFVSKFVLIQQRLNIASKSDNYRQFQLAGWAIP